MRIARGAGLHPGTFFYPSLQIYVDALCYRFLALFGDPVSAWSLPTVYRVARTVTVVFASASLFLSYSVATRMSDRFSALAALVVASASFLHVSNSFLATTDVPMGFWALLAAFVALNILRPSARFRDYVLAGVCAGCATGTKYNGVFAVLPILVAHLIGHGRSVFSLFDRRLIAAGAVAAVTFFVTTPYALIDHDLFRDFIKLQSDAYSFGHPGNESVSSSYGFYAAALRDKYGLIPLIVSLGGWAVLFRTHVRETLVLIAFPLALFLFMGFYPVRFDRNIVALVPFLAIGASGLFAISVSFLMKSFHRDRASGSPASQPLRAVPIAVLSVVVGVGVWFQVETSALHVRLVTLPNTRLISREWIDENLPPGAKIGREHYTPSVDPSRFRVDELGYFGLIRTPRIERYDYLIASSGDFGRFVNHPDRYPSEATAYIALFNRWDLVKTFREDWTTVSGPEIRIYKRRPRTDDQSERE